MPFLRASAAEPRLGLRTYATADRIEAKSRPRETLQVEGLHGKSRVCTKVCRTEAFSFSAYPKPLNLIVNSEISGGMAPFGTKTKRP